MSFINDPGGYKPHGPRFGTEYISGPSERINLYQPPGAEFDAGILITNAEKDLHSDVLIDDYQEWCALNWKMPHGTLSSNQRISKKLEEESAELIDALVRSNGDVFGELGDVLWCTNAAASNLGLNVKHSLLNLLVQYSQGTRFANGEVPNWVIEAHKNSIDERFLSASKIDGIIIQGYEPQPSPVMNVDESSTATNVDVFDSATNIDMYCNQLASIGDSNYEPDLYQLGNTKSSETANSLIAMIVLNTAFIARHALNSSLTDVINHNIVKLSGRVAHNLIDKNNGERPNFLK